MGVQNATARRLAVAELTTTVPTLTLTGIAAEVAWWQLGRENSTRVLAVIAMLLGTIIGALLPLRVDRVAGLTLAAAILDGGMPRCHLESRARQTSDGA